jgi:hypothetical protein
MDSDVHFVSTHTVEHIMTNERETMDYFSLPENAQQMHDLLPDVEYLLTAMSKGKVILAAVRNTSDGSSANSGTASKDKTRSSVSGWTQVTLYPSGCTNADIINGDDTDNWIVECYTFLRKLYGMGRVTDPKKCNSTGMGGWSADSVVLQFLPTIFPEVVIPKDATDEQKVASHLADVLAAMYSEMCDTNPIVTAQNNSDDSKLKDKNKGSGKKGACSVRGAVQRQRLKVFALGRGQGTSESKPMPPDWIDVAKHDPLPEIVDGRVLAKRTYRADEVIELVPGALSLAPVQVRWSLQAPASEKIPAGHYLTPTRWAKKVRDPPREPRPPILVLEPHNHLGLNLQLNHIIETSRRY